MGERWAGATADWFQDSYLDVIQRATYFQVAYSSAPAMVMRTIEAGSKYPFAFRDANGEFLNGSNTYKLHLPPNPPAALFWAVNRLQHHRRDDGGSAATDAVDQRLQQGRHQQRRLGRFMVRPAKPANGPDSNWIQTVNGRNFLVALRLYGTGVEFFDQSLEAG